MWSILWIVEGRNWYVCIVGMDQVTYSISSFYTTCSYDLKALKDTITRIGLYIINIRCPLPSRSLWWGAVIYYVWSQAASSTSTPVNDFLHRPEWLGTTIAVNLIHSAAGYMCRWRQRNSEGGGQVPPVEKKWVTSITQNTACLVAELLPCLLRKMQMEKNGISACSVMDLSLCVCWFLNVQSWNKALHLDSEEVAQKPDFFYQWCFRYCAASFGVSPLIFR